MKSDESSLEDVTHRFHTTRWTAVLLSGQSQAPGYQGALGELYRIYWYPLYAYIRRRGKPPEEAKDLTLGFFLHLLEHKTLARADPLKGKFRSFLLGSLKNYLLTEADRARALKRGGQVEFVPLEIQAAEDRYCLEPIDQLSAEKIFEGRWAVTLLEHALRILRRQYAGRHKEAVFETLKSFIGIGGRTYICVVSVNVGFVSLSEALDLTTPSGRALAGMLAIFAECEHDILRDRVKAGIAQARKEGRPHGRPPSVTKYIPPSQSIGKKRTEQKRDFTPVAHWPNLRAQIFGPDLYQVAVMSSLECKITRICLAP